MNNKTMSEILNEISGFVKKKTIRGGGSDAGSEVSVTDLKIEVLSKEDKEKMTEEEIEAHEKLQAKKKERHEKKQKFLQE